jgi:hypothetical protein
VREIFPTDYALCLKFDDQEKLMAWKYLEAPSQEVLQGQIKAWVGVGPAPAPAQTRGVTTELAAPANFVFEANTPD